MADPAVATKRLRTHAVDSTVNYFKFAIGAAGAVGTVTELGSGDFVDTVVKAATGRYTVTLKAPFPATMVFCNPVASTADPDGILVVARYKTSSYLASAGTFEICTSDADDIATANAGPEVLAMSAVDPVNPTEIMVHLAYVE